MKIETYKDFADIVKKRMSPSLKDVFKMLGISEQLGGYYLKKSITHPNKKLKKELFIKE